MARRGVARALLIAAALAACTTGEPGPGLDVDRVMAHVDHLTAIGPRPKDSDGSRAAAGYIEDELSRDGLHVQRMPVGTVDLPEIRVLGELHRGAHQVHTTDPNLLVRFGPPGKALLLMAHYDTVSGSPGTIDNAVSVALLVELALSLRAQQPEQPVLIAFTANEEVGLVGAEALAAHEGEDVAFAIALDLIGGDGELTLNGASELVGLAELTWIADAAERAGVVVSAPLVHRVISRVWPQAERSDHGPFTRRGIRAIHFYNRGNDGEWIDLAYHSPRDTRTRVDRAAIEDVGRLLRALADSPVPPHSRDGFWLPFAFNTVVPRWLLVVGELALIVATILALLLGREGLVPIMSRIRTDPRSSDGAARPRLPGLVLGTICYGAALALACLAERELGGAHPAPWLHAPLHMLVVNALVLGGLFGLATRTLARLRPWRGGHRYLVVGSAVALSIGAALLVVGAAELAWLWLVPAFVISLAPRMGRLRVIAVVAAALPIVGVLHPWRVREAAWNGFLPPSLPLSLWLGALGIPLVATVAWWLRSQRPLGPLGTLVLGVGCGLAAIAGLVLVAAFDPACSALKFESFHLACERV